MPQQVLRYVRNALPSGQTLPLEVWQRRHRVLLGILLLHAVALPVFGAAQGYDVAHNVAHAGGPALAGGLAFALSRHRRIAAALVAFGLVTSSALLVHIWHGVIEGHFHFFVVIVVLALYEDWLPFLLAAAYVVVHHGLTGVIDPHAVYNHPDAVAHPWKWAAIHGFFVTAAGIASMAAWRLNETLREQKARANRHLSEAQRVAHIGSWEWDVAADEVRWSDELCRIFGLEPGKFPRTYAGYLERVHPDDREQVRAVIEGGYHDLAPYTFEHRVVRPDGMVPVVHCRGTVIADGSGRPVHMWGTAQDITERKRAEQLKEEFFALVSHELRTPLTSIRGYLDLLLEQREEGDRDEKFLAVIRRNASRLERLVGDLLFAAQLESGTLALEREGVDVAATAADCVEAASPRAEERGIDLWLTADPVPSLSGDAGRLAQALDNLISNALKYTPADGRVEVRVSQRDERILVEVEDTGIGISALDREQLFDRFFRASPAMDRAIPGVGLGLSITKAIVDGHGGRITVESREGEGTTFRVELPLARAAELAPS